MTEFTGIKFAFVMEDDKSVLPVEFSTTKPASFWLWKNPIFKGIFDPEIVEI